MSDEWNLADNVVDVYEETPHEADIRRRRFRSRNVTISPGKRILLRAAGVDAALMRMAPQDAPKYAAVGFTLITTALLSGTSLGLVLAEGFRSNVFVNVFVGALWATTMLNLDRWFVSAELGDWFRMSRSRSSRIARLVPRALLSVILALVTAETLLLAVFREDITDALDNRVAAEVAARTEGIDASIDQTRMQIRRTNRRLEILVAQSVEELENGFGPRDRRIRATFRRLRASLAELHGEVQALLVQREAIETSVTRPDGLLTRLEALDDVTRENSAARPIVWLIRLFLGLIFALPVVLTAVGALTRDTYSTLLQLRARETAESLSRPPITVGKESGDSIEATEEPTRH